MSTLLPAPDVVATFPPGTFLENLEAQPDGSILFTSYFAKQILRWTPEGVAVFAALDVHPVSVVTMGKAIFVAAHGASFASGPEFSTSMQVVSLDLQGRVIASTPAPEARFLNGSLALDTDCVLVADSLAGCIWAYSMAQRMLMPWFTHDNLKPVAAAGGGFALGANGIKMANGYTYVSNSSTTTLSRVRTIAANPVGSPELVAQLHGVDDFAIAHDGRIFIATHSNDVVMLDAAGAITVLADRSAEGATAVAFGLGPQAGHLFVTTTGGMFAGLKANANLLRIAVPGL